MYDQELNQGFWSTIGPTKSFTDPFYLDEFKLHTNSDDTILEYGCGYGRILSLLKTNGYSNLCGVDWAEGMINRAKQESPSLNLVLLSEQKLPFDDESFDAAIISTVLCCNAENDAIKNIVKELRRVLKKNGILYFCDFLITDSDHYRSKYELGRKELSEYGAYRTNEGIIVRHFELKQLKELLSEFRILWETEQEYVTMNNNPVRQYHAILEVEK
jgi:ubiquinone/menaquinone biosynthesis C-methylase UbiE